MFQFPWFPLLALCVQARVTPHDRCRVSPFGYLRIDARSTAPRSFSQSPTSFIGSRRQGIHRWLFVAWKSKMLVLAMEFSRCGCRHRRPPAAASPSHGIAPAAGDEGADHAAALRRRAAARRGRVAPSKRNRRTGTLTIAGPEETATYDGRARLEARIVSGQLGARWSITTGWWRCSGAP